MAANGVVNNVANSVVNDIGGTAIKAAETLVEITPAEITPAMAAKYTECPPNVRPGYKERYFRKLAAHEGIMAEQMRIYHSKLHAEHAKLIVSRILQVAHADFAKAKVANDSARSDYYLMDSWTRVYKMDAMALKKCEKLAANLTAKIEAFDFTADELSQKIEDLDQMRDKNISQMQTTIQQLKDLKDELGFKIGNCLIKRLAESYEVELVNTCDAIRDTKSQKRQMRKQYAIELRALNKELRTQFNKSLEYKRDLLHATKHVQELTKIQSAITTRGLTLEGTAQAHNEAEKTYRAAEQQMMIAGGEHADAVELLDTLAKIQYQWNHASSVDCVDANEDYPDDDYDNDIPNDKHATSQCNKWFVMFIAPAKKLELHRAYIRLNKETDDYLSWLILRDIIGMITDIAAMDPASADAEPSDITPSNAPIDTSTTV